MSIKATQYSLEWKNFHIMYAVNMLWNVVFENRIAIMVIAFQFQESKLISEKNFFFKHFYLSVNMMKILGTMLQFYDRCLVARNF